LSKIQLQTQFGRAGDYYYNIARGIDERPVKTHQQRKSVGNETTFENNLRDKKKIWQTLQSLASNVEQAMVKRELVARTLTLKVRYADFKIITRSKTADQPMQSQQHILAALPELLKKTEVGNAPIRLIGVTFSNLLPVNYADAQAKENNQVSEHQQLGLF